MYKSKANSRPLRLKNGATLSPPIRRMDPKETQRSRGTPVSNFSDVRHSQPMQVPYCFLSNFDIEDRQYPELVWASQALHQWYWTGTNIPDEHQRMSCQSAMASDMKTFELQDTVHEKNAASMVYYHKLILDQRWWFFTAYRKIAMACIMVSAARAILSVRSYPQYIPSAYSMVVYQWSFICIALQWVDIHVLSFTLLL